MQCEKTLVAWMAVLTPVLATLFHPAMTEVLFAPGELPTESIGALLVNKDWIARTTDNVCGLRDTNQISNPAKVDFKACLDATPEMKKVRQDKIDLTTPEGIRLTSEAVNRVTAACETTRIANGYCSVWKTIQHKDGRVVADITELTKAQY